MFWTVVLDWVYNRRPWVAALVVGEKQESAGGRLKVRCLMIQLESNLNYSENERNAFPLLKTDPDSTN